MEKIPDRPPLARSRNPVGGGDRGHSCYGVHVYRPVLNFINGWKDSLYHLHSGEEVCGILFLLILLLLPPYPSFPLTWGEDTKYPTDYLSEKSGSDTASLNSSVYVLQTEYENGRTTPRQVLIKALFTQQISIEESKSLGRVRALVPFNDHGCRQTAGSKLRTQRARGRFQGVSFHTRPSPSLSGEVFRLIIKFIDTMFLLSSQKSFDLIHSRHLTGAISGWKTYLK
ncbi:hypothetical protein DFP73DRAFT_529212 [Morchella snyderi]|nr:hypothetical protein DFP73DRAFT_529212 [Morchella snyderi]